MADRSIFITTVHDSTEVIFRGNVPPELQLRVQAVVTEWAEDQLTGQAWEPLHGAIVIGERETVQPLHGPAYDCFAMFDHRRFLIGAIHNRGCAPKWQYTFVQYRNSQRGYAGPQDATGFDSPEAARVAAEQGFSDFLRQSRS